jgi:hypothetical protein
MGKLSRRLRFWLDERRHGRTLDDEIAIHRALEQDALERRGLSPSDAARGSRRALGNVTLAREDAREVWTWGLAERLARDLRYALRALGRERTFAITAITTLGLAIAVTTTIFSVVHAALWCSRHGPSKCFRRGSPPTISAATLPFASTAGSFSSRCRRPLSSRSREIWMAKMNQDEWEP